MADNEQHRAALQELNSNYIRSVDEADVAWFDANLAADFFNTNPDGTFIDRKAFLAQIGRGSSVLAGGAAAPGCGRTPGAGTAVLPAW